jgi:hypothetical protein
MTLPLNHTREHSEALKECCVGKHRDSKEINLLKPNMEPARSADRRKNLVRVCSLCKKDICLEERPDLKCIDMENDVDNDLWARRRG